METILAIPDPGRGETLRAVRRAVGELAGSAAHPLGFDPIAQGDRMLQTLEGWLLDEEQRQAFARDGHSRFYLHASAYLCDIGLLKGPNGRTRPEQVPGETDPSAWKEAVGRASREMILGDGRHFGLERESDAARVAGICHADAADFQPHPENTDASPVDAALLAGCIRLARALDLKAPLTAVDIWQRLPGKTALAPADLGDFFDVRDIGPHPFFTGTVRVVIRCRHPELHRALKRHETAVQALFNAVNREVSPRFLFSEVVYEIEPDGYEPVDMKFAVDSSAAVQLFMGNRLYTDNRVFLRELIQNAADACRLRRLTDPSYEPAISVSFNADISTVTVRDNGIGMSRQWIEKYFLPIGISFYRSAEVQALKRKALRDGNFISQFGIGFLSGFLVAERIVIRTRKAGSEGLTITIADPRDYFDVRPLTEDVAPGTEVVLHLKPSQIRYSRSLEYPGYLGTNIRFLGIPVHFTDENGKVTVLGNEPMAYDGGQAAGFPFIARLPFADAEGYVMLSAKCNYDRTMYALESVIGGVSVFQDGIFVTQAASLLPEGARGLVAGRINLLGGDKCDLSMDRNRIFWTRDQLNAIKKAVRYGLVEVANQLMAAVDGQAELPVNTRNSILNHVATFFDFSDVDDPMHRRMCEPVRQIVEKRFRDFLRINVAQRLRTVDTVGAEGYVEQWQQAIVAAFAAN